MGLGAASQTHTAFRPNQPEKHHYPMRLARTEEGPEQHWPFAKLAACIIEAAIDDYRGTPRGGANEADRLKEYQTAENLLYGNRKHLFALLDMMGADYRVWCDILDDNRLIWQKRRNARQSRDMLP
jgi:hypothetical protein